MENVEATPSDPPTRRQEACREAPCPPSPLNPILHKWLVEYNPLYLLSATLVLGGVILISRALAEAGSVYGSLGVAAIAEIYAWTLIGGAALLTRLRLRRPAVMLALLTALYQGDITLHAETCVYLGGIGIAASLAWMACFVAKLAVLARAMNLRLSQSALLVPSLGALGLVIAPHVVQILPAETAAALVQLGVFGIGATALWTSRQVSYAGELDAFGRLVLRRALRATWALWTIMLACHVLFWAAEWHLPIGGLLPALALLSTRWIRSEVALWLTTAGTLLLVGWLLPGSFATTATMTAVVLALHAWRTPVLQRSGPSHAPASTPYRAPAVPAPPPEPLHVHTFAPLPAPAMVRLLAGSSGAIFLAVWTASWTGGAWPNHVLWLDALFTLTALVFAWRWGLRLALTPALLSYAHWAVQAGLITRPDTLLQWGALAVIAGFALLIASLASAWVLRNTPCAAPQGGTAPE